ncbi:uncharacterized protein F5891DRAFT_1185135 [Suillus fuscotomentosus]|uniref:Uncharacterized protein n=1 Tax=Suillus fuscotomentosus TaxID=1912939 RepID=A0AAD4EC29_9AGAM|nr:uncharacterized protein F5891DRAFT_1185135 [Suillus fuscotomentosus]KAG1903518.1 hypothetical protein F5891DRAFT_1185135 [Suillus fuscotomentosus]
MATTDHRKHTPVPLLLEAFPIPPSHIPPSPNPPPSLPPAAPLPPVPGPSPDAILFLRRLSSSSSDHSHRTRTRNGSLSSLRSFQRKPSYDLTHNTISEEGPPSELERPRSTSPDVPAIIQATSRSRSRPRKRRSSHLPNPHDFEPDQEDPHDSDSSIDLHTPLPHLMLRHGLLSPHSKLLPSSPLPQARLSIASSKSQTSFQSSFSDVSLLTNNSTGSKHPKDSRDTPSRRVRHRDGRLLRGGIGLTTGLGWSDSEDEDAPSPLTRRLSALDLSRRSSATSISTSQSYSSLRSPHPLSRSISHSILREENEEDVDEFGRVVRVRDSPPTDYEPDEQFSKSLPLNRSSSKKKPLTFRSKSRPHKPKDDNARVPTSLEDGITPTRADFRNSSGSSSSGLGTGTGGGIGNGSSTASTSSLSLPFPATPQSPVAFPETSSHISLGMGSSHPIHPISHSLTPSLSNTDKSLPPLPLTPKKYPPSLSRLRTYSSTSSVGSLELSGGLRVNVNDGEAGTGTPKPSLGGVPRPSLGGVPRSSLGGVPRPSLGAPRPSLGGVPRLSLGGSRRPSLCGVPRPSSSTPRPSMSHNPSAFNSSFSTPNPSRFTGQSGCSGGVSYVPHVNTITRDSSFANPRDGAFANPRDISTITIPSISNPRESGTQSPLTRSLALLQPGEQPLRPGGVLTYNRNVHDQLKRTQSQPQSPLMQSHTPILPLSPMMRTLVMPCSSGSVGSIVGIGNGDRPKSRTGTGMAYRSSSSPAGSRMRVPSTVRPSGIGVAL